MSNVMRVRGVKSDRSNQTKPGKAKNLLIVLLIFLFVSIVTIAASVKWLKNTHSSIFVSANPQPVKTAQKIDEFFFYQSPFNIILLGYGGGNHDGAYLTDSIIVANINPKTKAATLISIPRDTWVKMPTNGSDGKHWKVNAAYAVGLDSPTGGGNMAKYAIGQITGLEIRNFVALDFSGFKKTIDTLGGVDVQIEKVLDDYEYPVDGSENDLCGQDSSILDELQKNATLSAQQLFPCRYKHLHFDKGLTHLDGKSALEYVRSRHSVQDGNDFGRSRRQRSLILAVKNKVLSVDFITKASPFTESLKDSLRTDLTMEDISSLLKNADKFKGYNIKSIALTDQNYLTETLSDDGQDVLLPKDGTDNWAAIKNWIASEIYPGVPLLSPVVKVENGTSIAGISEKAINLLKKDGLTILPATKSTSTDVEKTVVVIFNPKIDKNILAKLEKEFGPSENKTANQEESSYDVLITIGKDFSPTQE